MHQQFTATKAEAGEIQFGLYCVYLSDLDQDAEEHHFLGFQRTLPDPEEEAEYSEDEGFYVEYNGQENGCYQRANEETTVKLIELSERALRVLFTPMSRFHQGKIDATGDVPLRELVIDFKFGAEKVLSLREALQFVVGQDCEFRYTGGT